MKIKVIGEGHTLANALRKKLHEDDRVETAAYNIDHPLLSDPIIHIKVSERKSPKRALVRAARGLAEDYEGIQKELERALEQ